MNKAESLTAGSGQGNKCVILGCCKCCDAKDRTLCMQGKSSGTILGDRGLEVEPMAMVKLGEVFQAEGITNKPHSCLIISLYEAQRIPKVEASVGWILQPGPHFLRDGEMA